VHVAGRAADRPLGAESTSLGAVAPPSPPDAEAFPAPGAAPFETAALAEAPPHLLDLIAEAAAQPEAGGAARLRDWLSHAHPAVREAAREALVQSGPPEAVAWLREAAARATDPREAAALRDAATFLELPATAPVAGAYGSVPTRRDGAPASGAKNR
jgi:hypothetical protein